jgi:tetratricopeptide (TPR) repeat protein
LPHFSGTRVAVLDKPSSTDEDSLYERFEACRWLKKWNRFIEILDDSLSGLSDDTRRDFVVKRGRALMELGRNQELLIAIRELKEGGTEEEKQVFTGVEGQALYYAGEYDEVLDVLRSAELDAVPRVWLFRSLAYTKLGDLDEGRNCYLEFERRVGPDIIGRRKLEEAQDTTET